jgi:hypothetical protein
MCLLMSLPLMCWLLRSEHRGAGCCAVLCDNYLCVGLVTVGYVAIFLSAGDVMMQRYRNRIISAALYCDSNLSNVCGRE